MEKNNEKNVCKKCGKPIESSKEYCEKCQLIIRIDAEITELDRQTEM